MLWPREKTQSCEGYGHEDDSEEQGRLANLWQWVRPTQWPLLTATLWQPSHHENSEG